MFNNFYKVTIILSIILLVQIISIVSEETVETETTTNTDLNTPSEINPTIQDVTPSEADGDKEQNTEDTTISSTEIIKEANLETDTINDQVTDTVTDEVTDIVTNAITDSVIDEVEDAVTDAKVDEDTNTEIDVVINAEKGKDSGTDALNVFKNISKDGHVTINIKKLNAEKLIKSNEVIDLNVDEEVNLESVGNLVHFGEFRNKKYYYSSGFKVNYFQSYQICKDLGMRLLSVKSKEENDFLFKNVKQIEIEKYWTSGSNFLTGKSWIWMASGQPWEYTNWVPGEPSETSKKCIELLLLKEDDLKWNNEDCNEKLNFICENEGIVLNPTQIGLNNLFGVTLGSIVYPVFSYNSKSYYTINSLNLTFFDANRACQMIGLDLVSVLSEAENNELHKNIKDSMSGTNFWSGGTRIKDKINWYWLPSNQQLTYTYFKGNQSNSVDDKCLLLIFQKDELQWNPMSCDKLQNFICETPSYNARVNSFSRKPEVVERLPMENMQLTSSLIKIKIIPPSKRDY